MADLIDRDALVLNVSGHVISMSVCLSKDERDGMERMFNTIMNDIQNAPAVNRWIPCSERLPYMGVDVIVYVRTWREHKVQFGYRYSEKTWSVANIGVPNDEITHWMHLPEPPEKE